MKRRVRDSHFRMRELTCVLDCLVHGRVLPEKYRNHKLSGEFEGSYECHIQPNVLLIYGIDEAKNILYLLRIGSHPTLFE